jgi:hypothetical protein
MSNTAYEKDEKGKILIVDDDTKITKINTK